MDLGLRIKLDGLKLLCGSLAILIIVAGLGWRTQAESPEKLRRSVSLDLEPIEGAQGYEVEITRMLGSGEKKKPILFKLKEPHWSAQVTPGRYQMRLRSVDDRGVPGEWSENAEFWVKLPPPNLLSPKMDELVDSSEKTSGSVTFKWSETPGAKGYLIDIQSTSNDWKKSQPSSALEETIELPVGQAYSWKVTAIMKEGSHGESREDLAKFILQGASLAKPEVTRPQDQFLEKLQWSKPEYAAHFTYKLLRQDQGSWVEVEKNPELAANEIAFNSAHPTGHYRLMVQAKAPFRKKSEIASLEFDAEGGARSPAAIEQLRLKQSLTKPTHWYGLASYLITDMQVTTINQLQGKSGSLNAVGGTGRLGLGYRKLTSNWGYLGLLDLTGLTIKSKNFTFASFEAHASWSQQKGSRLLNFSFGPYLKEIAELNEGASPSSYRMGIIKNTGLHLGGTYWRPFSSTLGLQLNARIYRPITGEGPQGEVLIAESSYAIGALGSYRLSEKSMGLAGYQYRRDKGSYKLAPGTCGNPALACERNSSEITGHYLNLQLEYSF